MLCLAYLVVVGQAVISSVRRDGDLLPRSVKVGDLVVLCDDKAVSVMLYVVVGLLMFYAEVYMYRAYSLATALMV